MTTFGPREMLETKRAIYERSELPWVSIRPMKVRFMRIIASFDSKADNASVQFMREVNYLRDQSDL